MADIKVKNLTFAYDGQLTPPFKKVNLNIGLIGSWDYLDGMVKEKQPF